MFSEPWRKNSWSDLLTLKAWPFSLTERNWFFALLIVVGIGLLFWIVQLFETNILQIQPGQRLVENASDVSMRFLGIAHFTIAFLFVITSKRMKTNVSRLFFIALLALGALFCWGFSSLGAMKSPLAIILFYAFFFDPRFP